MPPVGRCKPEGNSVGTRRRPAISFLAEAGVSLAVVVAARAMCHWYHRNPPGKRALGTSSWLDEV